MERAGFKCEDCKEQKHLHIHHLFYQRGLEPWEYPNESLLALCEECHECRAECDRDILTFFGRWTACQSWDVLTALKELATGGKSVDPSPPWSHFEPMKPEQISAILWEEAKRKVGAE